MLVGEKIAKFAGPMSVADKLSKRILQLRNKEIIDHFDMRIRDGCFFLSDTNIYLFKDIHINIHYSLLEGARPIEI